MESWHFFCSALTGKIWVCRNSACGPKRMPKRKNLGQVQGLRMGWTGWTGWTWLSLSLELAHLFFYLFPHLFAAKLLSPTNTQGIFPTIEVLTEVMVKVKLKTGWFWWSMPFPARRFLFGFSNLQDSQVEGKGQRVEAEGGFESWDFLGDDLNGEFLEVHIVSTKMFNHPHTSCYLCVVF